MDRIYAIRLYKNGEMLTLENPHVNNLQSPSDKLNISSHKELTLTLPEIGDGQYLAIAADGWCGNEALWCTAEIDGTLHAFPDRASSYRANIWEHLVTQQKTDNYTFYLPLDKTHSGKTVTLHALFCDGTNPPADCRVWLCDSPN
jgi:hypothetical protein